MNPTLTPKYTDEQIEACVKILQDFVQNSEQLAFLSEEQRIALFIAAGKFSRPDKG